MRPASWLVGALFCGLLAAAPAGADELEQAHLALKADARALEKRAQVALESLEAGDAAPVAELARDLADFADRTREFAGRAPEGYLRDHLRETALELELLAKRLPRAETKEQVSALLDQVVAVLFWAFRG